MSYVIELSDVERCPASVIWLYDKYRSRIATISGNGERAEILEQMKSDYERYVGHEPENKDKLSQVYELLKRKCWEG